MSLALQFPGAGAAQDKHKLTFSNEPVYLVEKLWHFRDFIDDDQCARRFVFQRLVE